MRTPVFATMLHQSGASELLVSCLLEQNFVRHIFQTETSRQIPSEARQLLEREGLLNAEFQESSSMVVKVTACEMNQSTCQIQPLKVVYSSSFLYIQKFFGIGPGPLPRAVENFLLICYGATELTARLNISNDFAVLCSCTSKVLEKLMM